MLKRNVVRVASEFSPNFYPILPISTNVDIPKRPHDGAKTTRRQARWPKRDRRRLQGGPTWLDMTPRWRQDGQKCAQDVRRVGRTLCFPMGCCTLSYIEATRHENGRI